MDIRIVEGKRIVNVSRIILEVQGRYIVGITEEQKQINVKMCKDEKEAERVMEKIIEVIVGAHLRGQRDLLIMMEGIMKEIKRGEEEDGREDDKEEYKDTVKGARSAK